MKTALFAFNGDPMCFGHVLLNGFDMKEKGYQVTIVIEGSATKLVKVYQDEPGAPFADLYRKACEQGLIGGICKACSNKMGSLESAKAQGLTLLDEMMGHPSMASFEKEGYRIITF